MSEIELTEKTFETEVINATLPVLVDFWAPWCGPCKMIAPVVDELAREYDRRLKVGKVNTDANLNLSSQYQVTSIPTILIFKDKKVAQRIVGFKSKADLKKVIDDVLR